MAAGLVERSPNSLGLLARAENGIAGHVEQILPAKLAGLGGGERNRPLLQICQIGKIFAHQLPKHRQGVWPCHINLGKRACAVDDLHLLADKKMIQVLEQLVGRGRRHVNPVAIPAAGRPGSEDIGVRDDLGLEGSKKGLAAAAGREVKDIVGAEIVQEAGRVRAGQLDLAVRGKIKDGGMLTSLQVLLGNVGIAAGHQPAVFVCEIGAHLGTSLKERTLVGHCHLLNSIPAWVL